MGIWLEPPDYGPWVSLESEPAASCIDCLRSARAQTLLPITASRYFFIGRVFASAGRPAPAANRPYTAGKTAPRAAEILGSFTPRYQIS